MEMPALMVIDILNNAHLYSSPRIRCCIKSITSCTFVLWTRCSITPQILCQLNSGQGCLAATNLEFYRGDHDLWDYCTFGVEAANDAHTVWVNTACGKEHSQEKYIKNDTVVLHRI